MPFSLSRHFTLAEATFSSTASRLGIDNSNPSVDTMINAKYTAVLMETVRSILGNLPLHIDSWIRCIELNRALGSADTSQHITGEAVDFICPVFGTPIQIAQKLIDNVNILDYDQLIYEHTWIHISKKAKHVAQRRQVLTLMPDKSYATGIVMR